MKKLSKIMESFWGDVHKRSRGDEVRREDDINCLDGEGLYEYLKNIYKELDSFQSIKLHPTMNTISVPIFVKGFKPYKVFFEFDNEEIFIEHAMAYAITGFFSKLWGKFHLQRYDTKQGTPAKFYIFPKDGSDVTNRFFIEVIDFLIDCITNSDDKCIERIVNESFWGDVHKRSRGDEIRKEDAYNPEYIDFGEDTTVYWAKHNFEIDGETRFTFDEVKDFNNDGWRLPTTEEVQQLQWKGAYTNFRDNTIDFLARGPKESRGQYLKLTRNYTGKGSDGSIGDMRNSTLTPLWTSTISGWNKEYIDAYGFDNVGTFKFYSYLPEATHAVFMVKDKKVTESFWGDVHKRSRGDETRKEDDVNLLDCDGFCDYLKNRYECDMTKSFSGFSANKTDKGGFINIPLFVIPGKKFDDSSSFTYYTDEKCLAFGCSYTYYKMKCLKLLEEKCMTLDNITFDKRGYIRGDITHSLVIEFIDFILDTIKYPMIASIERK